MFPLLLWQEAGEQHQRSGSRKVTGMVAGWYIFAGCITALYVSFFIFMAIANYDARQKEKAEAKEEIESENDPEYFMRNWSPEAKAYHKKVQEYQKIYGYDKYPPQ